MAGIPSIASLERKLQYAKQRKARLEARQKQAPKVGSRGRQPRESVKYSSIFDTTDFIVLAPRTGIAFFGGLAALGLAQPDASPAAPRGFKPAKLHATRGKSTPSPKTALSGRRYLKYTVDTSGDAQGSFSAPVSADSVTALKTRIQTIIRDKTNDIGEYGRIYFEPERPIYTASGEAAAPPATP